MLPNPSRLALFAYIVHHTRLKGHGSCKLARLPGNIQVLVQCLESVIKIVLRRQYMCIFPGFFTERLIWDRTEAGVRAPKVLVTNRNKSAVMSTSGISSIAQVVAYWAWWGSEYVDTASQYESDCSGNARIRRATLFDSLHT